jgi:uncharacterized membrane protein
MLKKVSLYVMSGFYVLAGINHFINPGFYESIIPPRLPYPSAINYTSGLCEIIFGILLIPVSTRTVAAWLMIVLLIAVFPANVQMTINYWHSKHPQLWITIVRLPLQAVLIWWAWIYTKNNSRF